MSVQRVNDQQKNVHSYSCGLHSYMNSCKVHMIHNSPLYYLMLDIVKKVED